MLLAIDAGNTRIKWGLFDTNGNLSDTGACLHDAFGSQALPNADHAIIASVANDAVSTSLRTHLNTKSVDIAAPTPACKQLTNDYAEITQLGIDRWAAAIAAWELTQSPCLIVNAGTAITVDAIVVNDDIARYIGGWIAPGLHTMQQTLAQTTAQLTICNGNPPLDAKNPMLSFGLNTQTSIKNGTMAAAVGMIQLGCQTLARSQVNTVEIVISGGDGMLIAQQCEQLGLKVHSDEHLVLKGLYAIHDSTNLLT